MPLVLPKNSDGILLREFRFDDAEPLAEIEYDLNVKRYIAVPSRERTEWLRDFSPGLIRGCAIEAIPEQVLAGRASISRTGTQGEGELEIVIARRFWGQRLGRKTVALLIPAAFEEMSATSVIAVIHPDNQASLKLIQSSGFTYRDKKRGDPKHWQYGHLIYELTRTVYSSSLQII